MIVVAIITGSFILIGIGISTCIYMRKRKQDQTTQYAQYSMLTTGVVTDNPPAYSWD